MEKISLERAHKGKKHIFFLVFYEIYLIFLKINVFLSINVCNLKALNFGF